MELNFTHPSLTQSMDSCSCKELCYFLLSLIFRLRITLSQLEMNVSIDLSDCWAKIRYHTHGNKAHECTHGSSSVLWKNIKRRTTPSQFKNEYCFSEIHVAISRIGIFERWTIAITISIKRFISAHDQHSTFYISAVDWNAFGRLPYIP